MPQFKGCNLLEGYDIIYVSPHLDDAAYSCSGHIRQLRKLGKKVLVLTVFSKGVDAIQQDGPPLELNIFSEMEGRLQEDMECMRELDVDWCYLDFQEVVFRHGIAHKTRCLPYHIIRSFVASWFLSRRANQKLVQAVSQVLEEVLVKTQCKWLVGPAGIGFHPDHLIVHRACSRVTSSVLSWFYYDFPYYTWKLLYYLRMLSLARRGFNSVKINFDSDDLEFKCDMVCMYKSQLKELFSNREAARRLIDKNPWECFFTAT